MSGLIEKIRQLLRAQSSADSRTPGVQGPGPTSGNAAALITDDATLRHLMRQIEETYPGEYSCAETYDLLDEYVDLVRTREEAAALMPYVKRHLDHCPNCTEQYEILLNILES